MSYTPAGTGGPGALELVDEQVIAGAAANRFEFTGLDGDADGVYEIYWFMVRANAADRVFCQPNGDSADQTVTWTETAGTPANPDSLNEDARWYHGTGIARASAWGRFALWVRTGSFRAIMGVSGDGEGGSGATYDRWLMQGMWRNNVNNITDIDLITRNAAAVGVDGWGIGSRAQLWKRPF